MSKRVRLPAATAISVLALTNLGWSRALASSGESNTVPPPGTQPGSKNSAALLKDTVATTHPRLISLAPSNTELLCSIGAASEIVGVCSFCDFPGSVGDVSKVGTFVSANLERLSRIKPDRVLLVSGQEMLAAQLSHNNFKTLTLDNTHLENIAGNLLSLGRLAHKESEAKAVAADFEQSLQALRAIVQPAAAKHAPTVFYCVWPQPLMAAGRDSFLNEVLTTCGGTNIAGTVPAAYPRYSMEQLVLKNPDVIIMPFEARGQSFLEKTPWTMLKAVKEKRLYFLPDQKHDMLSRPTLRVLKGIAWLTAILHPEVAPQLNEWQKSASYLQCAAKGSF
ncbi:MAG: ABC transporter substrate-binding protein [Cyanobacteria bacterium REEB67]|nr:ABC transporter substrate-binding protein [Cyanobacteria bacterium REEB67]